jgi:hypothetical protein
MRGQFPGDDTDRQAGTLHCGLAELHLGVYLDPGAQATASPWVPKCTSLAKVLMAGDHTNWLDLSTDARCPPGPA